MTIVTAANHLYFHGLLVLIASVRKACGGRDDVRFHVLDTGLTNAQREVIGKLAGDVHFPSIDDNVFRGWAQDYGGGYSTYARLLMAELVPEPRALYIDADVLVRGDLSALWESEIPEGVLALATPEYLANGESCMLDYDCPFATGEEVNRFPYFNCGFLLVDLDAWRRECIAQIALELVKGRESKLKAWDQTILNYLLRGKIGSWPRKAFVAADWRPPGDALVLHYLSPRKPWNSYCPTHAYHEWYDFHRRHVHELAPFQLGTGEYLRGWGRELRDRSLLSCALLARVYLRDLERRQGKLHARAYEEYLELRSGASGPPHGPAI